jgi:hypothetical protein
MASISTVLEQIKRDPLRAVDPDLVCEVCERHGHVWRNRDLPPPATIGLFIQQILQGNLCCNGVRHIAKRPVSGSAWCQARYRLPLAVYRALLQEVYQRARIRDRHKAYLWHGHRTFHIDGTGFSMSDTQELREEFGLPNGVVEGCGFPVGHLLVLFNACNGLLADAIAAGALRGDLADVPAILQHLQGGDILIGDESFGCYVVLALLRQATLHGLFPVHHARIVDFTAHRPFSQEGQRGTAAGIPHSQWVRSLGKQDQLVKYFKPSHRPDWIEATLWAQLPDSIVVRELRRKVYHPEAGAMELTMVTTLTNPRHYSAAAITKLRGTRWGVETNIGHLKTTMKMDVLHCLKPEGIRRELCVFALVYNLVRLAMLEAAKRQKVRPERISFADVLHWLQFVRPGEELPTFVVNPLRPDRLEPRVVKRRNKDFPYMTKQRWQYKQARKRQPKALT